MLLEPVYCLNDGVLSGIPSQYLSLTNFCHIKSQGGSPSKYKEKVREFMDFLDKSLHKFIQKKL